MEQFSAQFKLNMGLTNKYVGEIGKLTLKHDFKGVGSVDCFFMLKRKISVQKKPVSFILNLSDCTEKGSHFVALYVNSKEIIYFDSYGLEPFSPEIINFINSNKKFRKFTYNSHVFQNLTSIFCGYYCLAFLMSIDMKFSRKNFNKKFKDLETNDKTCLKFITNCIKKTLNPI